MYRMFLLCIAMVTVVSRSALALENTPTGFVYPTGTSQYGSLPGWLAEGEEEYYDGLYHLGKDMAADEDDPVYAIDDGDVYHISYNGWGTGNIALLIRHRLADGTEFLAVYGHITSDLSVGTNVVAGQVIGAIGPYSAGDHLHFGIRPGTSTAGPLGRDTSQNYPDPHELVDPIDWITTRNPGTSRFADVFNRNGGATTVGTPDQNSHNGLIYSYGPFFRQDFTGGTFGDCCIMYDPANGDGNPYATNEAYLLRTGFYEAYKWNQDDPPVYRAEGWVDLYGCPTRDEYATGDPGDAIQFFFKHVDDGEFHHMYYDASMPQGQRVSWNSSYTTAWVTQTPNAQTSVEQGQTYAWSVQYRNTGTTTWFKDENAYPYNYVALVSSDDGGAVVPSFFYDASLGWIDFETPCTMQETSVAPGSIATFTFQGRVAPNAPLGSRNIYFRPCHSLAGLLDDWGGMHYVITVFPRTSYDFDGDRLSDAWDRTSTGLFHIDFSDDGLNGWEWTGQSYGGTQDTPCPADYDGDGICDIAVLRNSDRKFLIDVASNNLGWFDITNLGGYGGYGDTPVPADYDGDGAADIALRWADGTFKVDYSSNGFTGWDVNEGGYGGAYDTPCAGDFNGDGHADVAILRNSDRKFLIDYWAPDGFKGYDVTNLGGYGGYGDTPCPADYDHDGTDDVAVRDADGDWHIDYHANGFGAWDANYGGYGSTPDPTRPGDYDGDGYIDFGVYMAAYESVCFDRLPYGAWDACDDGHPSWRPPPPDPVAPEPDGPTVTLQREDRKPVTVELFDVSGRLITSQVRVDAPGSLLLARRIIHERSLPGGVYFVRLSGPTAGRTTQKLVILR